MTVAGHDDGLPRAMRLPIAAVAFGDIAWAHVPVELFASFGQAIAAASPFTHTRPLRRAQPA